MEEASFPRCKYRPLKRAQDIRVLILLPGDGIEEPRCVLKHIRLKKRFLGPVPDYIAISYTWGSPDDTQIVRCDYGRSEEGYLRIPSNLYHALKHLRFERVLSRRLWADAMCINQEDVAERSQQVQMMRQIFSEASEVPIWLGPHTERTRHMCEIIDSLEEFYNSSDWLGCVDFSNHPDLDDDIWELYKEFFHFPWFTRVWVFQEAVVARKLCFVLGDWVA